VKTRAFTVPTGRQWVTLPLDGDGPCIAQPGETVLIVVAHTWEAAMREAMEKLMKPEAGK
jgi:hypothetical protein